MTWDYDRERLVETEKEVDKVARELIPLKQKLALNTITVAEQVELDSLKDLHGSLEQRRNDYLRLIETKKKKPTESKAFSDADSTWIEELTGVDTSYREWNDYQLDNDVHPGPEFKTAFERVGRAFHQTSKAGRRVYLNLFLSDIILRPEFEGSLRIFTELDLTVVKMENGKKRKLSGRAAYTIGFGKGKGIFDSEVPRDIHMVVVESKVGVAYEDMPRCIAEAATVYKNLVDGGKKTTRVWGILSNAEFWTFIFINEFGQLSQSNAFVLDLCEYDEAAVLNVYRILYYIVKSCYELYTPQSSVA